MSNRISITRGDTFETVVAVENENGTPEPLDITDASWTIATVPGGPAELERTLNDGVIIQDSDAGTLYMFLTDSETESLPAGTLWHSVRLDFTDGRIKTVLRDYADVIDTP